MKFLVVGSAALMLPLSYAAGFFLLSTGIDVAKAGMNARTWPTVVAHLQECTVTSSRAKNGTVYRAEVKYDYAVGGMPYSGDTLKFDKWSSSYYDNHAADCERVNAMAPFMVRYDPEQPQVSTVFPSEGAAFSFVLYLGVGWLSFTTLITIALLVVTGYGRAILGFVRKKLLPSQGAGAGA